MCIAKKFEKDVRKRIDHVDKRDEEAYKKAYDIAVEAEKLVLEQTCDRALWIREILIEKGLMSGPVQKEKQCYFITIRPAEGELCLASFKQKVFAYLDKKMFVDWALTFEQKDPLGTGAGMHCHIMARVTHRSKGEILRNSIKSFEPYVAANCIDIKPCKTPIETFRRYCIEYTADDGHKELTQEGDKLWRAREGLDAVYARGEWASLSSPGGLQENV